MRLLAVEPCAVIEGSAGRQPERLRTGGQNVSRVWGLGVGLRLVRQVQQVPFGNRGEKETGMAARGTSKGSGKGSAAAAAPAEAGGEVNGEHPAVAPRALALTQRGIRTGEDFADLMSALMSDLIEGNLSPMVANATVNAGGKLLKVVEMQYRYGNRADQRERSLLLSPGR